LIAEKTRETVMKNIQNVRVENTEHQDWMDDIQKKLDERGIIAVEGNGILTAKDVSTAIDVIDTLEASRDETEEWNHIRKLQSERSDRLSGGSHN